jgi:hypothetical protein
MIPPVATPRNRPETISAADIASVGFQIRDMVRRTRGSGRRFFYEARVVVAGESHPVHSIYGAWHAATEDGGIRELEAEFGSSVGRDVKSELSMRAAAAERRINESMDDARRAKGRRVR